MGLFAGSRDPDRQPKPQSGGNPLDHEGETIDLEEARRCSLHRPDHPAGLGCVRKGGTVASIESQVEDQTLGDLFKTEIDLPARCTGQPKGHDENLLLLHGAGGCHVFVEGTSGGMLKVSARQRCRTRWLSQSCTCPDASTAVRPGPTSAPTIPDGRRLEPRVHSLPGTSQRVTRRGSVGRKAPDCCIAAVQLGLMKTPL